MTKKSLSSKKWKELEDKIFAIFFEFGGESKDTENKEITGIADELATLIEKSL